MAADIKFEVTSETNDGKSKVGTLKWPARGLSSTAKSGPHGKGALPDGTYTAKRNKMLDKVGQAPYCDKVGGKKHCWMQPFEDAHGRTELGIHPDGNEEGTEGCIGLKIDDTASWYDAFHAVAAGSSVTVEVVKI